MRSRRRGLLALVGIGGALAWGGFLASVHVSGRASALDRVEAALTDMRVILAGERQPSGPALIVAIDDEAVRKAGRFPLPRATLAELVRRVRDGGASAVGIDLLLVQPDPAGGDEALAAALSGANTVVAAAATFPSKDSVTPDRDSAGAIPAASDALWPIEPLRRVAETGFVNVTSDVSGVPRHVPLLIAMDGRPQPSFALRLAMVATGSVASFGPETVDVGGRVSALDSGGQLPLRFYGPAGTVPTIGAARLLDGTASADALKGRIVLIGATTLGGGDVFTTPFDPLLPGVEILATAVNHLMIGDGLMRTEGVRVWDAIATVALPVATVLLMSLRSAGLGAALVTLAVAGWAAGVAFAFSRGVWLNMAAPIAATLPVALAYGIARRQLELRRAQDLAEARLTLRQFQPPVIADRLEAEPSYLVAPITQDAAILFVDLNGFTNLAERIGPERTQDLLFHFHGAVDRAIEEQDGVVLSYMGDGAMAAFGVPERRPDDAVRALAAAFVLAESAIPDLVRLSPECPDLGIKLGLHAGPVVASRLGGGTHRHVTVTGDTVNVASRLQEVAAENGAVIACSEQLLMNECVPKNLRDAFGATREVAIRGRDQGIAVRFWPRPEQPQPLV